MIPGLVLVRMIGYVGALLCRHITFSAALSDLREVRRRFWVRFKNAGSSLYPWLVLLFRVL